MLLKQNIVSYYNNYQLQMNNYIPLPNLVFLSPYCYLQTKFFPVDLWPKAVGHKSIGKNEKW